MHENGREYWVQRGLQEGGRWVALLGWIQEVWGYSGWKRTVDEVCLALQFPQRP